MKTLIILMLLLCISSQSVMAEAPKKQMLKRLYEMRQRMDRDRQQDDNEARGNMGSIRTATVDSPTVSSMRREMNVALAQISNNYSCLDVDIENKGGNTVVVCGNNNGGINGQNTTAAGNVIGSVNTSAGGSTGSNANSGSGGGGLVNIGPLGNPVYNSGTYSQSTINTSSNTSIVEGDVNGILSQSNTQAGGDIGNRTAVVNN